MSRWKPVRNLRIKQWVDESQLGVWNKIKSRLKAVGSLRIKQWVDESQLGVWA